MIRYTPGDMETYYDRIVGMALKAERRGDFAGAMRHADNAAQISAQINAIYCDERLERMLGRISRTLLPRTGGGRTPHKDRYIFYDQIGNTSVLALQYLRALMSWGAEFLYILEPGLYSSGREAVFRELDGYPKASVMVLADDLPSRIAGIGGTYEKIAAYGAGKALIHSPASGAFGVVLWHALGQTVRYRIVPGDHHFYLGTSVTDRAIEFRAYGATVAIQKRGFDRRRVSVLPYYPIVNDTPFGGLPEGVSGRDKVRIFSAGGYYKTFGAEDIYFKLVRDITERYPQVVVLFAGGGDGERTRLFRQKIRRYSLEGRMIPLGYRKDMDKVMEACDIYLGTTPICGGLSSQYAAICGKPVLQYSPPELKAVNDIGSLLKDPPAGTFTRQDEFYRYAGRLIEDAAFRRAEGEAVRGTVPTPQEFSRGLLEIVSDSHTFAGEEVEIDYGATAGLYMNVGDELSTTIEKLLVSKYGIRSMWLFPKAFIRILRPSVIAGRIKKRL